MFIFISGKQGAESPAEPDILLPKPGFLFGRMPDRALEKL